MKVQPIQIQKLDKAEGFLDRLNKKLVKQGNSAYMYSFVCKAKSNNESLSLSLVHNNWLSDQKLFLFFIRSSSSTN